MNQQPELSTFAFALDDNLKQTAAKVTNTIYKSIGDVSRELNIPAHVLRFWEGKFTQLKPVQKTNGRRYYRADDINLLKRIQELLYDEGYTIRGVQKLFGRKSTTTAIEIAQKAKPSQLKNAYKKSPQKNQTHLPFISSPSLFDALENKEKNMNFSELKNAIQDIKKIQLNIKK